MTGPEAGRGAGTGRTALVTAAANGIGEATAHAFARAGYRLVLADIDRDGLERVRADLDGSEVTLADGDCTTEAGAAAAVEQAVSAYGELAVLVNAVGGSRPGQTVADLTLDEWNRWVAFNLTSVFLMCRAALPHLVACRGAVVNVASGAGLRGMRANPAYVAAKAGVAALTRAMALDHGPRGVRFNCVAPGPVRTPLMRRNRTEAEIAAMGGVAVLGRIGEPEEIAEAILWLAGDGASYVMGQTVEVDGGVASMV
ncbi:SDR family NAD(P)-dependent oxidoreductase [Phytohabitans kaempferiae]|uniref:SDR family NAD(P)-dependent oxidoreductase n=1 Tax=Phytohabitans kaempferiae TaxID=1620943 RepID=A0ABV6LZ59_9ACTN